METLDKDKHYFELTAREAVSQQFEIAPDERKMGSGEPDLATDMIRMYIGTNPVAYNLKELFKKSNRPIPPKIQIFKSYNVYIINHTVGIVKEGGWEKVRQIGYRMKFMPGQEVTVLDVMPQSKYVTQVGATLNFDAQLDLNGELSPPNQLTELLNNIDGVGVGGKLKVAAQGSVVGRFTFDVITPEIQSIGKGNDYSEWIFKRVDHPLVGDDIEMFQIVLVNRFAEELKFEASIYSTISTWNFIPSSRKSEWINVTCKLNS